MDWDSLHCRRVTLHSDRLNDYNVMLLVLLLVASAPSAALLLQLESAAVMLY